MKTENFKTISENRKARHEYFVLESMETGIELMGTEVKSLRLGQVNLKDSWCSIDNGELFIKGMHISPYEKGNIFNRDPMRVRKLLMHRKEINRLFGKIKSGRTYFDSAFTFILKAQSLKFSLDYARVKSFMTSVKMPQGKMLSVRLKGL